MEARPVSKYASLMKAPVPQTEKLTADQVQNAAGGFVYALDPWKRLDRFLILGSDSNTYYQKAPKLTRENAACVTACWAEDPARTAARIREISVAGRAPKVSPQIFALAIGAAAHEEPARRAALAVMRDVCRTASHLFEFVDLVRLLGRGWGRSLKRAVGAWYTDKPAEALAFQAIKYRERNGYSHKRLLQLSHPKAQAEDKARIALYRWIVGKEDYDRGAIPPMVLVHQEAMKIEEWETVALCQLVEQHRLPWEALPTWANTKAEIWRTMVPHMGLTALIRNLGNISKSGAVVPLGETERAIVARLGDVTAMRKARVHPFSILQASAVYGSGSSVKGNGTWTVSQAIMSALDKAFYAAFANVEPTGKRFLFSLDVSGSMTSPMGGSVLSCRDAAAALALVTMATEPSTHVIGFTGPHNSRGGLTHVVNTSCAPLPIQAGMSLRDAIRVTSNLSFGTTDCSLPFLYALEHKIEADVFVVITDNETYAGREHPSEALRRYRKVTGIDAKLIVIGMTATGFTIADPNDAGMLDMVGFDSDGPAIIAEFARG